MFQLQISAYVLHVSLQVLCAVHGDCACVVFSISVLSADSKTAMIPCAEGTCVPRLWVHESNLHVFFVYIFEVYMC